MIELLLAYALSSTIVIDERGYQWWSERMRPALAPMYVALSVEEFDRRCPGRVACERMDLEQKRCWVYYAALGDTPRYSATPPDDLDPYAKWHAKRHCDGFDHR